MRTRPREQESLPDGGGAVARRVTRPEPAVLALQRAAGNAAVARLLAPVVVQRQQPEAAAYIETNALGIEATRQAVVAYVEDDGNDTDLRAGLLAAWNENSTKRWAIEAPADLAKRANPFRHDVFPEYRTWKKGLSGVTFEVFGGTVSAHHNQGAAHIGSNEKNWPGTKLGDTYDEYVRGLQSGDMKDAEIAQALLDLDQAAFETDLERRAAAMITATVYLAEEWRKQGAAKIYRAFLRCVANGSRSLADVLTDFPFVVGVTEGQRAVARVQDVLDGVARSALSPEEQEVLDMASEIESDDFSTDDEVSANKDAGVKKKRRLAQRYKPQRPAKKQRTDH